LTRLWLFFDFGLISVQPFFEVEAVNSRVQARSSNGIEAELDGKDSEACTYHLFGKSS